MKTKTKNRETEADIKRLVVYAMLTAIVALLTLFASIPLPVGDGGAYLNAGDAAVYASAYILGPVGGAVVSGLGSAIADVLHGSVIYAPVTLVIKAVMALICGALLKKLRRVPPFAAGLVMPVGYFAYEAALYGAETALFGLWTNLIQYAFGSAAGMLLFIAFERAGVVKFGRGEVAARRGVRPANPGDDPERPDADIKRSITDIGDTMIEDGLTTGTGGNISFYDRASGRVYITPTTMPYNEITENDIPVYTIDGEPIEKPREPSMELWMHLNIYRARPDVNAVIHTHSPALKKLAETDENPLGLPVAPVYPVGSKELAEGCVRHLGEASAVLLRGHGAVMVGKELYETYYDLCVGLEMQARKYV